MYVIIARVQSLHEKRDAFIDALRTASDAARKESGCLKYGFYASIDDDTVFTSVEEWADMPSIEAHFRTPGIRALMESLMTMLAGPPSIEVHEVSATTGPPGA